MFIRSTSTFGPILAERADTIGARCASIGFAYQRPPSTIENLICSHSAAHTRQRRAVVVEDVITTVNSIDSVVTRSAAFVATV